MNPPPSPFIPPAPKIHRKDLPDWRMLLNMTRSSLSIWPESAFETLVNRRKILGRDTTLVNDLEGLRHVLTANAANYERPVAVRRVIRPLGGSALFAAEGAQWRRQRRLLASTFTPASVSLLLPHFHEAARHLLCSLEKTPRANLSRVFHDASLEAVLRALFSLPQSAARNRLHAMVRAYVEGPGRPNFLDILAPSESAFAFATRRRARFQKAWFAAIDQIVAERRGDGAKAEGRDMLDLLLSLAGGDADDALSDAEIREQCATMIFAASETTSRLMFWAAYLLTQDLEEQARLRAEIAAFPPERAAAIDDLQHWPRLRNVLLEALRLYPPVPHILRDAIAADEICGEKIAAGDPVWISAWVLHRHRKYWDQPTAFNPDRFAGKAAPWTQSPAYIPFGAGPRICIGFAFALAEAQIVLATLLSRYRIALPEARPVLPIGSVTIEPCFEPLFRLEPV
jgi:cytochrome P450